MAPRITVESAGETAFVDYTLPTQSAFGEPVSFRSVAEAREALGAPATANYVMWPSGAQYLHQALRGLGANDILVLPEREQPYLLDTRDGFRAAGVDAVENPDGSWMSVKRTYFDTGSNANMWFAMTRAQKGIMGMGPGAVIRLTDSAYSQGPQKSPPLNVSNPTTEQQRRVRYTNGAIGILSGAQEKLIETEIDGAFFGNFKAFGRSLGGVAFTGITAARSVSYVNLALRGFGSGFSGVPNGEAGALAASNGTYRIENVDIDSRDEAGTPIGTSPIMWNRSKGGTMKNVRARFHRFGMPAMWGSTGYHQWEDVFITDGHEVGVNFERNNGGLTLEWKRGALEAASGTYHVIVNSHDGTSQKMTFTDVEAIGGRAGDGVLTFHGYNYGGEAHGQRAADLVRVIGGVRYPSRLDHTGPSRSYGTIYA